MIDYYEETMNKLTRQMQRLNTNSSSRTASRSSVISEYKPSYSNFDLIKYECPSLGNKIQFMLQYLEFKLQVENKYSEANKNCLIFILWMVTNLPVMLLKVVELRVIKEFNCWKSFEEISKV